MNEIIKNLEQLCLTPGISGNEAYSGITKKIFEIVKKVNNKTVIDSSGNVISIFGKGNKKILIDAHLDEVGFLVSKIDNNKIKLVPIGDIDIKKNNNSDAYILNKNLGGKILGNENDIIFKLNNEREQDIVLVGDVVSFKRSFNCNKDKIVATALDNRIGCACLISLMEKINLNDDIQIIFTFTTGEEKDASTLDKISSIYEIDFGIIVDASYAKPINIVSNNMSIPEIGSGCAIQYLGKNFVVNKNIINKIEKFSKENNVKFQKEIPLPDLGRTNFPKLQQATVPGCVINIPVKDQHTQISEANLKDLDSAIDMILLIINMFNNDNFKLN